MADTFSISSSTFAFIMGGISLLGLIVNVTRFHLPSNKIKVLESLLDETETFFKRAVEDGLLLQPSFVRKTEQRLEILKDRTCDLQTRVYTATTLRQDYIEFFRGTSTAIGRACQTLKRIRAEVIVRDFMRLVECYLTRTMSNQISSEEGRNRRTEMHSAVLPLNPVARARNRPGLPPAAEIVRRHSCPPSLSAWTSDDTQSIASRRSADPSSDPTQIDSDVQTTDVSDDTSSVHTSDNLEHET